MCALWGLCLLLRVIEACCALPNLSCMHAFRPNRSVACDYSYEKSHTSDYDAGRDAVLLPVPWALLPHVRVRDLSAHASLPAMFISAILAGRDAVLLPVLRVLLPHVRGRLDASWGALLSPGASAAGGGGGGGDTRSAAGAKDEVVAERLLRELTREHMLLLSQLQARDPPPPGTWGAHKSEISTKSFLRLHSSFLLTW